MTLRGEALFAHDIEKWPYPHSKAPSTGGVLNEAIVMSQWC